MPSAARASFSIYSLTPELTAAIPLFSALLDNANGAQENVYMAKLAEQAERYDEVRSCLSLGPARPGAPG